MTTDPAFVCEIPGHARCTRDIRDGEFWVTHHPAAEQDDFPCCSSGEHATPPTDAVREALDHLDALNESGRIQYADYVALHDMVSRIEVRPCGTVTGAEVQAALNKWQTTMYRTLSERMRFALEAAFEIRPRGTVTDAEVNAAADMIAEHRAGTVYPSDRAEARMILEAAARARAEGAGQ